MIYRTFLLTLILAVGSSFAAAQTTAPASQANQAPSQTTQQQKIPRLEQKVEVIATRLPEEPEKVPAAIQVFNGDELRSRGVSDLRSALALATGVEIAPGGDAGPASSVPDFWGLKEFDAFLLVVDGVPWGGAFNPALTTLDLNDLDRIEVLRGPAPVTYGATSFVGVIHVVHRDAASDERTLSLHGGSFGSGGGLFSTPIPLPGDWSSRLTLDAEREGYNDDRTSFVRGHALYRVSRKTTDGRFWVNGDMNWLDQDPASPRPREGNELSPLVPVDSNQNPAGAFLNDHRFTGMLGYDRGAAGGQWSTTGSVSHSRQDIFRGFLGEIDDIPDNAHGLREKINLTDVYVDSHLSWKLPHSVTFLMGGDYLHGTGNAHGADFDYTVPINGARAVQVEEPDELDVTIDDYRNFFGPYASVEWSPFERFKLSGGIRLNITDESRDNADPGEGTSDHNSQTNVRASGSVGALVNAWSQGQDSVDLFVNYRDTFKPAAIDFGIGEEEEGGGEGGGILEPETSRSVEGGIKGRLFDRRVEFEASGFLMHFNNLVSATEVNGLPALVNTGEESFKGFETGTAIYFRNNIMARATYSFHDATFTDLVQDFDGVPTQLAGNRLEMSARNLVSAGLMYTPNHGILGGVSLNYTGSRYLNKRNTALADGFVTVDLSAGYRTPRWEVRVDARNIGDRRDPVSESELGDAQYYLMTNRRVDGTFTIHF
jgi:outer membrane receptor protein involved in Fe transport